jgi:hypothetical protein
MSGARGHKPNKLKHKNVSLDVGLIELLNAQGDKLAIGFGFRPTLSQTIRHLIKKSGQKSDEEVLQKELQKERAKLDELVRADKKWDAK